METLSELVTVLGSMEMTKELKFVLAEFLETIYVSGLLITLIPVLPVAFLPLFEAILLLCAACFFSLCFFGVEEDEKIPYGLLSFLAWIILAGLWLFIQPLSYPVSLLFMALAFFMLLFVVLLVVNMRRIRGEEASELD